MGLKFKYFYSLTYRQFTNILNGYQKKEDNKSKERWLIARKMMYASIIPHAKEGLKETDLLAFPWEDVTIKKLSEEQLLKDREIEQLSKQFFDRWDKQNAGKA